MNLSASRSPELLYYYKCLAHIKDNSIKIPVLQDYEKAGLTVSAIKEVAQSWECQEWSQDNPEDKQLYSSAFCGMLWATDSHLIEIGTCWDVPWWSSAWLPLPWKHCGGGGMKGILKKVKYCNISNYATGDRSVQGKLSLASEDSMIFDENSYLTLILSMSIDPV